MALPEDGRNDVVLDCNCPEVCTFNKDVEADATDSDDPDVEGKAIDDSPDVNDVDPDVSNNSSDVIDDPDVSGDFPDVMDDPDVSNDPSDVVDDSDVSNDSSDVDDPDVSNNFPDVNDDPDVSSDSPDVIDECDVVDGRDVVEAAIDSDVIGLPVDALNPESDVTGALLVAD